MQSDEEKKWEEEEMETIEKTSIQIKLMYLLLCLVEMLKLKLTSKIALSSIDVQDSTVKLIFTNPTYPYFKYCVSALEVLEHAGKIKCHFTLEILPLMLLFLLYSMRSFFLFTVLQSM